MGFLTRTQGKCACWLAVIILLIHLSVPNVEADVAVQRASPMVDPYIDAIDCIQTNGTNPCDDSDTGKWPHNATIYRRDSQTNETAAVIKLRIEGKGDPGGTGARSRRS